MSGVRECIACGTRMMRYRRGQLCGACWLETNPALPVVDRCGCVSLQSWEVKRRVHRLAEMDRPPPSLMFDALELPASYPIKLREFAVANYEEDWHPPMAEPVEPRWAFVWREKGATDAAVLDAAIDFMIGFSR